MSNVENSSVSVPKFIIHIGPHKTGTKYIQRRLDENAGGLLAQGIYVPTHWRDSTENPSHTKLARSLSADGVSSALEELENWRHSDYSTVVISSEMMVACSNQALMVLKSLLSECEFLIVYYVRRWSALLLSRWNEAVVGGETAPFLQHAAPCLMHPEHSDALNFDIQLDRFAQVFGQSNIRLISYDTVIERGGDIFRHFTRHFLSSPTVMPPAKARANESTEPEKTELCRILNVLDQEAGNQPSTRMIFALRRRKDIDLKPMVSYIGGFRRSIVLRSDKQSINQVLKINRAKYADCFVPPVPQSTSYEPRNFTAEFIASDYMLAPGFAETIRGLYAELIN